MAQLGKLQGFSVNFNIPWASSSIEGGRHRLNRSVSRAITAGLLLRGWNNGYQKEIYDMVRSYLLDYKVANSIY